MRDEGGVAEVPPGDGFDGRLPAADGVVPLYPVRLLSLGPGVAVPVSLDVYVHDRVILDWLDGGADSQLCDVDLLPELAESVELPVYLEQIALRVVHLKANALELHARVYEVAEEAQHSPGGATDLPGVVPSRGDVLAPCPA